MLLAAFDLTYRVPLSRWWERDVWPLLVTYVWVTKHLLSLVISRRLVSPFTPRVLLQETTAAGHYSLRHSVLPFLFVI